MPLLRKRYFSVLSLIPLLLLIAHPSFSETDILERSLPADTVIKDVFQAGSGLPVGKIQSVRGETVIFHRDPSVGYRAQSGLPLYQGDILHTYEKAWIQCRLVDGSKLALAPGTMLTIFQSNSNSARKSSLSFLSLTHGDARFYVSGSPEFSTFEYKIQTPTAFVQVQAADFVVKTDPGVTEIITFEKSRLEVTSLAQPEEVLFMSDFQRVVVRPESASPAVETVSREEADMQMAEFHLAPDIKVFAYGPGNYRAQDTTDEALED